MNDFGGSWRRASGFGGSQVSVIPLVGGGAPTTIAILNFRASSGFVTDGAGQTYVLHVDGYPTNRGGLQFGWTGGSLDSRDRDSGGDPRLAGINFNTSGTATFQLDLPSAGTYNVFVACGDASGTQTINSVVLKDDTTTFATLTGSTGGANRFIDATNTVRTSQSDWINNSAAVTRSFGSSILKIDLVQTNTPLLACVTITQ